MKINIKKLDGTVYDFEVTPETTVPELKKLIEERSTIAIALQRVIYKGKVLRDDKDLQFYNIEDGVTLHLAERAPESVNNDNTPNSGNTTTSTTSTTRNRSSSIGSAMGLDDTNILSSVMRSIGQQQIPFDTQIRNAISNINNPSTTLVTGPVPPPRDGREYDPQSQPAHERLSNYIDLTTTEINQLMTNINAFNQQLRNNNEITDTTARQQIQTDANAVGLALSRLSTATNLLSQCVNAFRPTNTPTSTHFVPSVSQITLNLGPNGLTPVTTTTTTPADLLNFGSLTGTNGVGGQTIPIPGMSGSYISVVPAGNSNTTPSGIPFSQIFNQARQQAATTGTTSTRTRTTSSSSPSTSPPTTSPPRPSSTTSTTTTTTPLPPPSSTTTTTPLPPPSSTTSTSTPNTSSTTTSSSNIPNVISQTLDSLFTSLGQQPGSNPLGGIIQNVLSSVGNGGVGANGQPDLSNLFSMFSGLPQQTTTTTTNPTTGQTTTTSTRSPFSSIITNLPSILLGFQLIVSNDREQTQRGHRNIRQTLVQEILGGNSTPENVERVIDSFAVSIRQQVLETTLTPELSSRVTNRNYPEIASAIARKYITRFFKMFLVAPDTEGYDIHGEIDGFSNEFVRELVDSLATCFENGVANAFEFLDLFVNQKVVTQSPMLVPFSQMTSEYLRDVYESAPSINSLPLIHVTLPLQQATTSTTSPLQRTTTTTTTTSPPLQQRTTTTTTTTSSGPNIIPPEWRETIEIDEARQSTGTSRTPSSTYFKGKKVDKNNNNNSSNNNNNNNNTTTTTTTTSTNPQTPFETVLQDSLSGTQVKLEEPDRKRFKK